MRNILLKICLVDDVVFEHQFTIWEIINGHHLDWMNSHRKDLEKEHGDTVQIKWRFINYQD